MVFNLSPTLSDFAVKIKNVEEKNLTYQIINKIIISVVTLIIIGSITFFGKVFLEIRQDISNLEQQITTAEINKLIINDFISPEIQELRQTAKILSEDIQNLTISNIEVAYKLDLILSNLQK